MMLVVSPEEEAVCEPEDQIDVDHHVAALAHEEPPPQVDDGVADHMQVVAAVEDVDDTRDHNDADNRDDNRN